MEDNLKPIVNVPNPDFVYTEKEESLSIKIDDKNRQLLRTAKKILNKRSDLVEITKKRQDTSDIESINESSLREILNNEDYIFYQTKKELYLSAYPDLTDPFDLDDLHLLIMEQIFQRNLFKQKKKNPAKDITEAHEKSVKRLTELKKSLSLRRTDRLKDKTVQKNIVNIASISAIFATADGINETRQRIIDMQAEEKNLRNKPEIIE